MLTAKQKEERKLGIGGSDISIILGLSNFKTPYELFLDKTSTEPQQDVMMPVQYWGHRLEPIIREEFELRNQVKVETPETQVHPVYDYMRANIDGFIRDWNSVFEAKCSGTFMSHEWGQDGSDIIPLSYLVQVAHYVSVMNANEARIAVLIGGNDYREYIYTRDLQLESRVIDAAKEFWRCVQENDPPPAINEDDLKLMFPISKPEKKTEVNDKIIPTITSLSEVKAQMKQLAELENQYRFEIMEHMKDSECLIDSEGKNIVTWKANKKGSRSFLLKGF